MSLEATTTVRRLAELLREAHELGQRLGLLPESLILKMLLDRLARYEARAGSVEHIERRSTDEHERGSD